MWTKGIVAEFEVLSTHVQELRKNTKKYLKITGLRVEIWIWDLPDMTQACYPLDRFARIMCELVTVVYESRISNMMTVSNFEVIYDICNIKRICI
jgi:hypothetical protein